MTGIGIVLGVRDSGTTMTPERIVDIVKTPKDAGGREHDLSRLPGCIFKTPQEKNRRIQSVYLPRMRS